MAVLEFSALLSKNLREKIIESQTIIWQIIRPTSKTLKLRASLLAIRILNNVSITKALFLGLLSVSTVRKKMSLKWSGLVRYVWSCSSIQFPQFKFISGWRRFARRDFTLNLVKTLQVCIKTFNLGTSSVKASVGQLMAFQMCQWQNITYSARV